MKAKLSFSSAVYFVWIGVFAAVLIVGAIALYAAQFGTNLSTSSEAWSQFGDFFGGALNPLLSFLALLALLITVMLQSRQLELSASELELTREELKRTADAASEQSMRIDELEYFCVRCLNCLWQAPQQVQELVPCSEMSQSDLADHKRMRDNQPTFKQTRETVVPSAQMIDPNRGIY